MLRHADPSYEEQVLVSETVRAFGADAIEYPEPPGSIVQLLQGGSIESVRLSITATPRDNGDVFIDFSAFGSTQAAPELGLSSQGFELVPSKLREGFYILSKGVRRELAEMQLHPQSISGYLLTLARGPDKDPNYEGNLARRRAFAILSSKYANRPR